MKFNKNIKNKPSLIFSLFPLNYDHQDLPDEPIVKVWQLDHIRL